MTGLLPQVGRLELSREDIEYYIRKFSALCHGLEEERLDSRKTIFRLSLLCVCKKPGETSVECISLYQAMPLSTKFSHELVNYRSTMGQIRSQLKNEQIPTKVLRSLKENSV